MKREIGRTVVSQFGLGALLAVLVLAASSVATAAPLPHHHQMEALYVIDHHGVAPRTDAQLLPYSTAFQQVLGGCVISTDDLMMVTINLAEQASVNGGRDVTLFKMLSSIARRVVWKGRSNNCGYVYNVAEAYSETGAP